MKFTEKRISSETIYDGRILKLEVDGVQLPDGHNSVRECVRHSGGAAVLLIKEGKILLVNQFRYLYGKEIFEIPAGKLNKGEDPEFAAARELEEETGFKAELVHMLDLYPSPGYTDEIIHIYFAKRYEYIGNHPDVGEFLSNVFIPIKDVIDMIEQGRICDAKTVSAVYKYIADNKINK